MISLGGLDLLEKITGGGEYDQLLSHMESIPMFGIGCRVLDIGMLIATKRAAGRLKDLDAIAELTAIRDRK